MIGSQLSIINASSRLRNHLAALLFLFLLAPLAHASGGGDLDDPDIKAQLQGAAGACLLYTSPSPRDS